MTVHPRRGIDVGLLLVKRSQRKVENILPKAVDRLLGVVDQHPGVVDRILEVVDRIPEVVDRIPEVVDRIPGVVKSHEKGKRSLIVDILLDLEGSSLANQGPEAADPAVNLEVVNPAAVGQDLEAMTR